MKTPKLPIRYRAATAEDANFIFNSWLKSYRYSQFSRLIANEVYYTEHHKILESLVKECKVIVACNQDDPSQIYGYICAGELDGFLVVHYVYVKHSFRNMGIGKSLLNVFDHDPSTAAIYTHNTRIADRLAPKYNLVFHPYVLFKDFSPKEEPTDEDAE